MTLVEDARNIQDVSVVVRYICSRDGRDSISDRSPTVDPIGNWPIGHVRRFPIQIGLSDIFSRYCN